MTLQTVVGGLNKIGEELNSTYAQDPFIKVFPPFVAEAKKEVTSLKEPVLAYQNDYLSILRAFGEDSKTPIVDFFKVLAKFLAAFQVSTRSRQPLPLSHRTAPHTHPQKCFDDIRRKKEKRAAAKVKSNVTSLMDELKDKILAPQTASVVVQQMNRVRAPTTCLLME